MLNTLKKYIARPKIEIFGWNYFFISITNFILPTFYVCLALGLTVFFIGSPLDETPHNAIKEFIGLTGIKISLHLLIITFGLSLVLSSCKLLSWLVLQICVVCFNLSSTAAGVFLGLIIPACLKEGKEGLQGTLIGLFVSIIFIVTTILIALACNHYKRNRLLNYLRKYQIEWLFIPIGIIFFYYRNIYVFN